MSIWQVNEEAINALNNLSNHIGSLTEKIEQSFLNLQSIYQDNISGLGAHTTQINSLIEEIKSLNGEAKYPSNKLRIKLNKAATIRKQHIENNKYKSNNSVQSGSTANRIGGTQSGAFQSEHKTYISNRDGQIKAVQEDVLSGSGRNITEVQAGKMLDSVHEFTGTGSTPIRIAYNNPSADAHDVASLQALDDYIKSAPKWKGTLYRGISVTKEQADNILSSDSIDMLGPASWSSEQSVAERFSNGYKDVRIVFILDDNKSGSSISHIGALDGIESEVTAPSGIKYGIDSIKRDSGIIYVDVHEK